MIKCTVLRRRSLRTFLTCGFVFTMSDRLIDLEVELRDVIVALKDVAGTQWYNLGLQLKLSPSILDTIAADHQTSDDCKRMMLRKWLQSDPEASWEKLALALSLTGHETTAAAIRSHFSLVTTVVQNEGGDSTEEDKIRLVLARKNLNKIKGQFSSLLVKVQSALKSHQVSVDEIRSFLVHYSSRDDWIQNPSNLDELFTALSVAKLWSYDHYDLLEEITKRLLPDDVNIKKLIFEYKGQLTGFYTTTKVADFIKLSEFKDSEQDPQQPLPVHSYTFKDYRKLKVKLKLDRKVSTITLAYVDELWRSLAEEFDLPCLTAVIHSIIEGSLVVTWLVLPHIAEKITANSSKAAKFFRRCGIVMLEIDDLIIYDEEMMVTFEKELFVICKGFPNVDSNTASRINHLLNYGVDPNISDKDGYTPLFWASMSGLIDIMKILLRYGANVNQHCDKSALHAACLNGHSQVAKLLIENGAVINAQTDEGYTPLLLACSDRYSETVAVLLRAGAMPDIAETNGVTSLMLAAGQEDSDGIVAALIEAKADPNIRDRESGRTALWYAAEKGNASVVEMLLKSGASMDIRDKTGLTAYDVASIKSQSAVCNLLEQYGYQSHDSAVSSSGASRKQPRQQRACDEITSLDTFRTILEHVSSRSQDNASQKHQTSQMSKESEEMDL